jgi:hypothetical protein
MAARTASFILKWESVGARTKQRGMQESHAAMNLVPIVIILLVLALIGVLPTWGYSASWGYAPGSVVGLLLVVVLVLALMGRL